MNVNQLKQSKFLTRADVGRGTLVTINGDIFQENVAKEGAPEEPKYCLAFNETEKPMVLNSTNGQMIAKITGSEESEKWHGHKIVLYDDPNVSFGGKLVGGIRVRAPRLPATIKPPPSTTQMPAAVTPTAAPAPTPAPAQEEDDIPC